MNTQLKMQMLVAVIGSLFVAGGAMAAENAIIKNKAMDEARKEIATAATLKKINGLEIEDLQTQTEVSPGEHTLEIDCVVRTFVGMGTVDLGKMKQFTLPLDAGRTYQLGAKMSPDGECTPVID
jgi:hypothetical protein